MAVADAHVGKYPPPWMPKRKARRLVVRYCICGHGQGAHHDGHSYCVGEKYNRRADTYSDCTCERFTEAVGPSKVRRR